MENNKHYIALQELRIALGNHSHYLRDAKATREPFLKAVNDYKNKGFLTPDEMRSAALAKDNLTKLNGVVENTETIIKSLEYSILTLNHDNYLFNKTVRSKRRKNQSKDGNCN